MKYFISLQMLLVISIISLTHGSMQKQVTLLAHGSFTRSGNELEHQIPLDKLTSMLLKYRT